MDKFTLNTAIKALRNVKNETITTRQIYDYGGISGMAIGILVAGACIAFACYTCFTRTPSERTLRQSHPPAYEPPPVRYIPAPTTRNNTPITITSPPRGGITLRPLSFRPRSYCPGHFVPSYILSLVILSPVISSPGHFVPWSFRPLLQNLQKFMPREREISSKCKIPFTHSPEVIAGFLLYDK
jgi:hypothetical protein